MISTLKLPSEYASAVRSMLRDSENSDEAVFALCVDAVMSDNHVIRCGIELLQKVIRRSFNCLRRELESLDELASDDSISEIMVNGTQSIFYEKKGIIYQADFCMDSREQLSRIIQRLCAKVGREMNDLNPIVDARLDDGSRINAVNDNVAINGPVLTIRKFCRDMLTMEELIENGDISREAADFITQLVRNKYNIFISGATSTGKTTFLNILSGFIPANERIIVIEDNAELQIRSHSNLVRMETRAANLNGKGGVTARDLIKTSLRMRPDRIIVGEVRGDEVIDMLAAMSTGHEGSLSTGHAGSPQGMIHRLETLCSSASSGERLSILNRISEAIDIIVQLKRDGEGHRRVVNICELCGIKDGEIVISDIFIYDTEKGLYKTGKALQKIR